MHQHHPFCFSNIRNGINYIEWSFIFTNLVRSPLCGAVHLTGSGTTVECSSCGPDALNTSTVSKGAAMLSVVITRVFYMHECERGSCHSCLHQKTSSKYIQVMKIPTAVLVCKSDEDFAVVKAVFDCE